VTPNVVPIWSFTKPVDLQRLLGKIRALVPDGAGS
jgi:hypothetical protein